jgi:hypothetical protein
VGRKRELAALRAGLVDMTAGHSDLFLLSGEPGIGTPEEKKRLQRSRRTPSASHDNLSKEQRELSQHWVWWYWRQC